MKLGMTLLLLAIAGVTWDLVPAQVCSARCAKAEMVFAYPPGWMPQAGTIVHGLQIGADPASRLVEESVQTVAACSCLCSEHPRCAFFAYDHAANTCALNPASASAKMVSASFAFDSMPVP